MAINKRTPVPEGSMSLAALVRRRQAEGHGRVMVSMDDEGRWVTSMLRPGGSSAAACNIGQVGEPLDNVIHNLLVMRAEHRKPFRPKDETQPTQPKKKLLKLRKRTPGK